MKVFLVGGNGTIGKRVSKHLKQNHQVLTGGRTEADIQIDITDHRSIRAAFQAVGKVDAIICIAGEAKWDRFQDLTEEDYYLGIKSKLMGQVNLVRIGIEYLNPNGSITLSTGILADQPVPCTTSAAMVNGAIHSFVLAVDLEVGHSIRVNVVSLGVVEDSYEKYKDLFLDHMPIPMKKAANAYARCVEGKERGQIIRVY